jgi:hypothetical protein
MTEGISNSKFEKKNRIANSREKEIEKKIARKEGPVEDPRYLHEIHVRKLARNRRIKF